MITKEQGLMLKELALEFVFSQQRYKDIPISKMVEKREAWEEMTKDEKAFNSYVDRLTIA